MAKIQPSSKNDASNHLKMSDIILDIQKDALVQRFTFQSLLDRIGPRGHLILCLFLTIPFCQPIPMFGLSTVFGLAVMIIAFCYTANIPPWLPKKYRDKEIPSNLLNTICCRGCTFMRGIEKFSKPRGQILSQHASFRKFCGVQIAILALFLALPIPIPGTNLIPAFPIIFLCLGLVEQDSYFAATGTLGFVVSCLLFLGLPILFFLGFDQFYGLDLKDAFIF
ncbi:MAG: exopolysaccharide biosynthesis protein [Proteobacteria bacterium]|nr:exopolysaccharide biosynthesis protein [Pseudomonadota bacterium]